MNRPVVTLSVVRPTVFDETLVEAEIVTYTVTPRLLFVVIVTEIVHDVLVDVTKQHFLVVCAQDCHGDEGDVGVGRLVVVVGGQGHLGGFLETPEGLEKEWKTHDQIEHDMKYCPIHYLLEITFFKISLF